EPRPAGRDLATVRLLVDAPGPAWLPAEVLDHVGDVGGSSLDPGVREGAGEELAGGPDEWPPGEILVVPGLLADQHHRRALSPPPEVRLRRALPSAASAALPPAPKRVGVARSQRAHARPSAARRRTSSSDLLSKSGPWLDAG